jgi:hypothetical protein
MKDQDFSRNSRISQKTEAEILNFFGFELSHLSQHNQDVILELFQKVRDRMPKSDLTGGNSECV